MPQNVEIKARVRDLEALCERVEALADQGPRELRQDDTFFTVPAGRLKLRRFADGSAELIHYRRADLAGPKTSDFTKLPVPDPESLTRLLTAALGSAGTVRKRRRLYLAGRTRLHVDEVEGLGSFLELEVVLEPGEPAAAGAAEAAELMRRLGIAPEDLVEGAYVDLLASAAR